MDTVIHVCYALNDISGSYAKFIGTSLCSLLENTQSHVVAHVLHDGTLNEDNKNRLIDLAKRYDQKICFYDILTSSVVTEFLAKIQQIYPPRYHGTFYRFAMGAVLPSYIDKIIYLDADTVINMDISKLWNVSLGDSCIAAAPDSIIAMLPTDMAHRLIKKGLVSQDKYFNAGVMLMDMKYFRDNPHLTDDVVDFLLQDEVSPEYLDQDFLNFAFSKSCQLLPTEYNLLVNYARFKDVYKTEAIIHYAGGALKLDTHDVFDTLFWHYLCKTPWQNENASMRCLSDLARNCRELARRSEILTLLLKKQKRIVFGSRVLASKVESFLTGTFYDSGEDDTTSLACGDLFDVFSSLPPSERVIVVLSHHYDILQDLFIRMGLEEGCDFVDGFVLTLPEKKAVEFKDSAIIGKY